VDDQQNEPTHSDILKLLCSEWDLAEAEIKLAEQVGSEVVIPSINELRYAGRRVIEAMALPQHPSSYQKLQELLSDSRFFCHRARHDAIDAAVAIMVENLEVMMETIGPATVMSCFADFGTLRLGLHKVQMNIVSSRKDRENRSAIYRTVSECDFPELVRLHAELRLSEPIMTQIAEASRRETRKNHIFGWGGIIFGAVGLIVGVLGFTTAVFAWKYPHFLGG